MAVKKIFSALILALTLVACTTSRNAQRTARTVPDVVPAAVTTAIQTPVQKAEPDTLAVGTYTRANINKVQRRTADTWQGALQVKLDSMCNLSLFETTQLGLCVYDLTDDCLLYAVNANQRMRPASNMKLVTAIAGLDILGTNYSYQPTMVKPGWGWCWDDEETGIRDFKQKGVRKNADTLYQENRVWTMLEVLQPMMKKSDNLLAESMFAQLPAKTKKPDYSRKGCVAQVENVIRKTGLNPANYVIADGSGVSLYSYLSPTLLTLLLRYAYQNKAIYDNLYPALPIAGVDGTLSKRMIDTSAQGNVHAKTGTVTGVSALSGYCQSPSGHTLCFSIMNQGIPKAAVGRDFQDKICEILTSY